MESDVAVEAAEKKAQCDTPLLLGVTVKKKTISLVKLDCPFFQKNTLRTASQLPWKEPKERGGEEVMMRGKRNEKRWFNSLKNREGKRGE